jgi:hypothetical protein
MVLVLFADNIVNLQAMFTLFFFLSKQLNEIENYERDEVDRGVLGGSCIAPCGCD